NHQDNCCEDPPDDFPGHGGGVAAFATQFVRPASAVRDEDTLEMLRTTECAATLAPSRRGCRAGVTPRPCRCSLRRPVRMTTLRARFGLGRDLTATRGAVDQRHSLLQRLRLHSPRASLPRRGRGDPLAAPPGSSFPAAEARILPQPPV